MPSPSSGHKKCNKVCRVNCPECNRRTVSGKPCKHCGEPTKLKRCKNPQGYKTGHLGQGPCYYHGGKTPIKHGRYSNIKRPRIKELLEKLDGDDDFDLVPEIRLLRAIIIDFTEHYDEITRALIKYNNQDASRPAKIISLSEISNIISQLATITEKAKKIKSEYGISISTLQSVMDRMGLDVREEIEKTALDKRDKMNLLDRIGERWKTIIVGAQDSEEG